MKSLSQELREEKIKLKESSKRINFLSGFENTKGLFYSNGKALCSDFSLATGYTFSFNPPVLEVELSESDEIDFYERNYYPTRVKIAQFDFYFKLKNSMFKTPQKVTTFLDGFDNSIFRYIEYNDTGGKEGLYEHRWYKKKISFLQSQEQILSSLEKLGVQQNLLNLFGNDLTEIYSLIKSGEFQFSKKLPNFDYLIKTKFQK